MSQEKPHVPFWIEFCTGWLGGISQIMVGQPFDIIKVRLQSQDQLNPEFKSTGDCFKQIIRKEGLLSFYKGSLTPILGMGVISSAHFFIFQDAKKMFSKYFQMEETLPSIFVAGFLAGALSSPLSGPVEHVRIRVQRQTSQSKQLYTGSLDATVKIYQKYGLRGLYKGLSATCVRDGFFYGCFFFFYNYFAGSLRQWEERLNTPQEMLLAGGVTGIFAWICVFPLDTFKTLAQTDSFENPVHKNYRGMIKTVLKEKGVKFMYNGFKVCMMRAVPVNSVTFFVYESSRNSLISGLPIITPDLDIK